MGNASKWLKEAALNHFFRNTPTAATANRYLALYKTNPPNADEGQEISGGGYVRQRITFAAPEQVGGLGTITNTNAIAFPEATADWTQPGETVGYWGIRTAATGGYLLAFGEFKDPDRQNDGKYAVTKFDQFNVGVGKIIIQFNDKASNWLQNAVLNHFFRNSSTASPANVHLALYMSNPTGEDIGVEVTYTGYERQRVVFEAPVSQHNGETVIRNSEVLDFPIPNTDLGVIAFFGLRTAATGGNLLTFASWSVEKAISAGMQFSVNIGNLELAML